MREREKKTEQSRLKTGRRELLHQRKRNKRNYKLFFFYWKEIIKTYTYNTSSRSNYKRKKKKQNMPKPVLGSRWSSYLPQLHKRVSSYCFQIIFEIGKYSSMQHSKCHSH